MKTVIIIPARYASTRYPGKPLVELTLPDGARKSLIQLSWEAACRVTGVDAVYVATDDARIRDAAQAFGADVIMTSETCRNGTERCAEALENAALDADLIVNLQGDAPLTPHWFVEDFQIALCSAQIRSDRTSHAKRSLGCFYPVWQARTFSCWNPRFNRRPPIGCGFGFRLWRTWDLQQMPNHAVLWRISQTWGQC